MVTTTESMLALRRVDRGDVDQSLHAPAVRNGEHDLLVAGHLGAAQFVQQRKLREGELAPVGQPGRHDLHELVNGMAGGLQLLNDPSDLAVDRHQTGCCGAEDHDTDRRGVDQRLEVGPGLLFVAVGARVGDGRRRLGREEHEHLFVLVGEHPPVILLRHEEAAHLHAQVVDRRGLHRSARQPLRAEPERPEVALHVAEPQRTRMVPQVREEARAVVPILHLPVLLRLQARAEEPLWAALFVNGREDSPGGACQRAGTVDDLLQYSVEVQARVDLQDRRREAGDALLKCSDTSLQRPGIVGHPLLLRELWRTPTWYRTEYRQNLVALNQFIAHASLLVSYNIAMANHEATGDTATMNNIDPTATIHPGAKVDASALVEAGAMIGCDVTVGQHAHIGGFTILQSGVCVGDYATIRDEVLVGPGTMIGAGSTVGRGSRIGREVELGARAAVGDRSNLGDGARVSAGAVVEQRTTIRKGALVDRDAQVGHRVSIGARAWIGAGARIGSRTALGARVVIGSNAQVGNRAQLAQGVQIPRDAVVPARTRAT